MRVACVLIDHFPLKQELRRHPHLKNRPIIVSQSSGSRRSVLDSSPQLQGIHPGIPLSEALSKAKSAILLEADTPRYHRAFDRVLDALEQKSPIIEPAELGCVYVGLDGLEGMYGGEARLITALLALPPEGEGARIGVAEGKFPSYVAAGASAPGRAVRVPHDTRSFLSEFPVEVFPLSWRLKTRLHSFGLATLGQIASLPPGPLQSQFGPDGWRIWRLSNGIDDTPLVPRSRQETVCESLIFPDPVKMFEPLVVGVEVLLGRVFSRPQMMGRYARVFTLEGQVYRAPYWLHKMAFKEPVGDQNRALYLVKSSLSSATLAGPLEDLSLTVSGITGEAGQQLSMLSGVRRNERLRHALKQLEARLGKRAPIYLVRDVEPWSRVPERRQVLIQYNP